MKKLNKLILSIIVVMVAMLTVKVEAATTTIAANSGSTQTWTVTREVQGVSNSVTNTFTYQVQAGDYNPGIVTTDGTTPFDYTNVSIVFNNVAPVNNVATQTATIDLSTLQFDEVGDYEFIVEETASSNASLYPVDDSTYYSIYVSVRYEVDGNNVPTGNKIATLVAQPADDGGTKVSNMVFASGSSLTYITLSNGVTGNLAEKDQYFAFTVTLPGNNGDTYTILGDHSVNGTTTVNSSSYTVGTTTTIYLKHGQSVTIGLTSGGAYEIPVGETYTVTENGALEYSTYIDGGSNNSKTLTKTTVDPTDPDFNANNVCSFVNNYQSDVLTGIFVNVLPFIILISLAIVGIYINKRLSQAEAN